jgi:hypothetical protein
MKTIIIVVEPRLGRWCRDAKGTPKEEERSVRGKKKERKTNSEFVEEERWEGDGLEAATNKKIDASVSTPSKDQR